MVDQAGVPSPQDARFLVVPARRLVDAVYDALRRAGVPDAVASCEAAVMVDADLADVPSHGVLMLPRLLQALRDGRVTADPDVRPIREHGAIAVLDGDRGPGRHGSTVAMTSAIDRARRYGVGACVLTRSTHWGRAYAYAAMAGRQGCAAWCTTNAIPTVAPPGVPRALVGNNPLAMAVPRGGDRDPVVLDVAMSQAAFGKVATFLREGRNIPAGWGQAVDGEPTLNPAAILASGLLAPMGGHKGLGLAVMFELLTAGLGGGPFGHEIVARDASGLDPEASKLFVALDVEAFGAGPFLAARVEDLAAHLHAAGVLLPGARGDAARAARLADGVPVHRAIVEQLAAAGVHLDG